MRRLAELQRQELQQVMQQYDEAMRKFDEAKIRKKPVVSDWGWLVGILVPIVLAIMVLVILIDPIMSSLPGGWMNLFSFVNYLGTFK